MAHHVFVSYSNQDKAAADAVCAALESRGLSCWIAPRNIPGGKDWGEAIVEAIEGARVLVLVFSSSANQSRQVAREIERADGKNVAVVPFRIEDVKPTKALEYFLSSRQWIDALGGINDAHLGKLASDVHALIGNAPAPVAAPARAPAPGGTPKWVPGAAAAAVIAVAFFMTRPSSNDKIQAAVALAQATQGLRPGASQSIPDAMKAIGDAKGLLAAVRTPSGAAAASGSAPEWVSRGSCTFRERGGGDRWFYGVGVAEGPDDPATQTADDRARSEVGQVIETFLKFAGKPELDAAGRSSVKERSLVGAGVVERWKAPSGARYALCRRGYLQVVGILATAVSEQGGRPTQRVREDADKVFDGLGSPGE